MWNILLLCGLMLAETSINACLVLDYSKQNISEDAIINGLRPPRPLSISELKGKIAELNLQEITELNLSENYISIDGAIAILSFAIENLPHLKVLNLAYNRIMDTYNKETYTFEWLLKQLLQRDSVDYINLSHNYLGNDWLVHIKETFPEDLVLKIKVL